jgi:hypothetical protein
VDKDFAWIQEHAAKWDVVVTNESDATGQVALQGPRSLDVLQPHMDSTATRMQQHPVVLCLQDTTELDFNGQCITALGGPIKISNGVVCAVIEDFTATANFSI